MITVVTRKCQAGRALCADVLDSFGERALSYWPLAVSLTGLPHDALANEEPPSGDYRLHIFLDARRRPAGFVRREWRLASDFLACLGAASTAQLG